jgi:hypothetical protein
VIVAIAMDSADWSWDRCRAQWPGLIGVLTLVAVLVVPPLSEPSLEGLLKEAS